MPKTFHKGAVLYFTEKLTSSIIQAMIVDLWLGRPVMTCSRPDVLAIFFHFHSVTVSFTNIINTMKQTKLKLVAATMAEDDDELHPPSVYRFYPTEQELISFYLWNKLQGLRTQDLHRVIPVVHVYEYNPCNLPSKYTSLYI